MEQLNAVAVFTPDMSPITPGLFFSFPLMLLSSQFELSLEERMRQFASFLYKTLNSNLSPGAHSSACFSDHFGLVDCTNNNTNNNHKSASNKSKEKNASCDRTKCIVLG